MKAWKKYRIWIALAMAFVFLAIGDERGAILALAAGLSFVAGDQLDAVK